MKTELPKISIVTVCYNSDKFLEKTFNSIFSQEYPNLEYIVIDGGSTDNTLNIIKKWSEKLSFWVSEKDKGMYDALNKGFSHATGDILCWLNSDDEYYPHTLHTVAKIFTDLPDVKWITGGNSHLNEDNQIFMFNSPKSFDKMDFISGNYCWIQQESTFWRKELFDNLNDKPFDLTIKYAGDFNLWFKFFQTTELYTTDIPLGKFRHTKGQISQTFSTSYTEEVFSIINSYKKNKKEIATIKYRNRIKRILHFLNFFKILNIPVLERKLIKRYKYSIQYDTVLDKFKTAITFR